MGTIQITKAKDSKEKKDKKIKPPFLCPKLHNIYY